MLYSSVIFKGITRDPDNTFNFSKETLGHMDLSDKITDQIQKPIWMSLNPLMLTAAKSSLTILMIICRQKQSQENI